MAQSILEIIFRTLKQGSGDTQAASGLKKMNSAFQELTGTSLSTAGAFGLVTAGIKKSIAEAAEAQKVDAQLNAVLESTGHAAGLSADELDRLATSLSDQTAVDDEAIKSAEALMLTFTKISGEVFPGATQAALDMSVAMGQDLNSSVVQIGKALNDPIQGITALTRVGVTFTDEQKNMIQAMVESGDVMGAQKLILQELTTEFGGSATAAAQTYAGQLQQLNNNVDNIAEAIGGRLLPRLLEATTALNTLLTWQDKINAGLQEHNNAVTQSAGTYDEYVEEMTRASKAAGLVVQEVNGQAQVFELGNNGTMKLSDSVQILSAFEFEAARAAAKMAEDQKTANTATDELNTSVDELGTTTEETSQTFDTMAQSMMVLKETFPEVNKSIESSTILMETLLAKLKEFSRQWTASVRIDGSGAGIPGSVTPPGGGNDSCFVAGTPVSTPDGPRAIELIKPGEKVLVLQQDAILQEADVVQVHVARRDDVVTVETSDGQTISCSPNHPWKMWGGGWCWAYHLAVGTRLVSDHGEVWVKQVSYLEGSHLVYNLTIEHPEHTFLVGGIVVHNVERKASGGPVRSGRTYLVGEEGPEILQMPPGGGSGRVIPNDQVGMSGPLVGQVVVNNGMDYRRMLSDIERMTRR
jgi:hypothetical protein